MTSELVTKNHMSDTGDTGDRGVIVTPSGWGCELFNISIHIQYCQQPIILVPFNHNLRSSEDNRVIIDHGVPGNEAEAGTEAECKAQRNF